MKATVAEQRARVQGEALVEKFFMKARSDDQKHWAIGWLGLALVAMTSGRPASAAVSNYHVEAPAAGWRLR